MEGTTKLTSEIVGKNSYLYIAIQSCNSPVILKKLSKLSNCNFDDYVYDRDIQHYVH